MKKKTVIAVMAIVIGMFVFSTTADANKYKEYRYPQHGVIDKTATDEAAMSLTDCMGFSASFKSMGKKSDFASFVKEFGDPVSESGKVWFFNYDDYTSIILDCSVGSCHCRCLSK